MNLVALTIIVALGAAGTEADAWTTVKELGAAGIVAGAIIYAVRWLSAEYRAAREMDAKQAEAVRVAEQARLKDQLSACERIAGAGERAAASLADASRSSLELGHVQRELMREAHQLSADLKDTRRGAG